jgi:hypothetical protein
MNLKGYPPNEFANAAFVHGCSLFQAKLFIEVPHLNYRLLNEIWDL